MADFDLQSYLDTVNTKYLKDDVFRRIDQKEVIDSTIQHKEIVKQLNILKPIPSDTPGPKSSRVYPIDFESLDWDNELLAPFQGKWSNIDEMFDFFNVSLRIFCQRLTINRPSTGTVASPFNNSRRSMSLFCLLLFSLMLRFL